MLGLSQRVSQLTVLHRYGPDFGLVGGVLPDGDVGAAAADPFLTGDFWEAI